jgi:hypothetical protein
LPFFLLGIASTILTVMAKDEFERKPISAGGTGEVKLARGCTTPEFPQRIVEMKQLEPSETDLVGKWINDRGKVVGDAATERIRWLTSNVLEKIGPSEESGGWDILYRDRGDGRYWEFTYPKSYMHGGGPPRLTCISDEEARKKYKLL